MDLPSYIEYANQGAIRNLPLDPRMIEGLAFLEDLGLVAQVYSGGQPAKGSGLPRVGSPRHDHGMAADLYFLGPEGKIDPFTPEGQAIYEQIAREAAAAGFTGLGFGKDYMGAGMHIGYGPRAVWGPGGKSGTEPAWFRNAAYAGWGDDPPVSPQQTNAGIGQTPGRRRANQLGIGPVPKRGTGEARATSGEPQISTKGKAPRRRDLMLDEDPNRRFAKRVQQGLNSNPAPKGDGKGLLAGLQSLFGVA